MVKTFLGFFVFTVLASAQPVTAGLKIGVPITDAFNSVSNMNLASATADGYELGFYVDVRLPAKLSIEGDVLHRGYSFTTPTNSESASSWEFPIVLKYHLLKGPVKPYAEGGLSFSHISDISNLITTNHNANFGIVLGAGVEIHALVLRISPEIRYTGNALKNFDTTFFQSNRNQVAFLIGIGF